MHGATTLKSRWDGGGAELALPPFFVPLRHATLLNLTAGAAQQNACASADQITQ
jgi:hypothetical protein